MPVRYAYDHLRGFALKEPFRTKVENPHDAAFLLFQQTHPAATYPEYLVYWWLTHHGYEEYRDFWYQLPFGGGRTVKGGFVADYLLTFTNPETVLEVYGVAFHSAPVRRGPESIAVDKIRKQFYEAQGLTFVRAKDTDLVDRLDYTMRQAINGHEIASFQ